MDPRYSAQDILLCDLCQIAALQSHCELCQINLCKACVGEHLSDSSKRHKVIPYKHRTSAPMYPKCPKHSEKNCELYCEKCDIPVCSTCASSVKYKGHILSDSMQKICFKRKILEEDLNELEKTIYPVYEEFEIDLKSKKESFEENYEKLATAVTKQEENVQQKIHIIVKEHISNIYEMKNKHRDALNKQEKEIKHITSDLKHNILELKTILDSDDVSLISGYKSRNP
ncbi:E3 ubiquitin-protein ligase TRIM45-like [Saccostrea cucullata]|uniref:E3 ubiquitin-protein ligase TRIM45-like n=1 Tax=Saccostrea cuccullata TaxID=36930 RepID=UPI002ED58952